MEIPICTYSRNNISLLEIPFFSVWPLVSLCPASLAEIRMERFLMFKFEYQFFSWTNGLLWVGLFHLCLHSLSVFDDNPFYTLPLFFAGRFDCQLQTYSVSLIVHIVLEEKNYTMYNGLVGYSVLYPKLYYIFGFIRVRKIHFIITVVLLILEEKNFKSSHKKQIKQYVFYWLLLIC